MYKENYEWYKAHNICPHCGRNTPVSGKVHCLDCLDQFAVCKMLQRANMTPEQRKEETLAAIACTKKRYQNLKEHGICVRCAKRKVAPRKTMCSICLAKSSEYQRLRRLHKKEKGG